MVGNALAIALTAALAALAGSSALAQAPAGKPPTEAEVEAAAAMRRAQRLASNPMRVILEASRIKTVRSDAGAQPAAAAAQAAPAAAAAPAPAPRPPVEKVFEAAAAPTASAPVDAIDRTGQASLPALEQAAPSLATLVEAKPRLVSQVEPVFPAKLLDDAAKLTEVLADLTLASDGTVKDVALLGTVPRPLQRPIVAALEAWRFEPLPAPRVHRVQLVFTGEK